MLQLLTAFLYPAAATAGVLVVVVAVARPRIIRDLGRAVLDKCEMFGLRFRDPVARYRATINDAAEQLVKMEADVREQAGEVEAARSRVRQATNDCQDLEARIKFRLGGGDEAGAKEAAVQLAAARQRLSDAQDSLTRHKAIYDQAQESRRRNEQRIASARAKAAEAGVQIKISESERKAAELSRRLSAEFGGELSELEREVDGTIAAARGAAQADRDMALPDRRRQEEDRALADKGAEDLLLEFRPKATNG